ncbi:MAG: CBM96 family carbohydrate-binding protein [Agriterribacter sp.]
MKKITLLFFLFYALQSRASDIDSVAKRIIRLTWQGADQATTITNAQNYSDGVQSDGSWSDISYAYSTTSNGAVWPAYQHLNRLRQMTIAYTAPWSSLNGNSNLYSKLMDGLNYWEAKNLSSSNWWFNDIANPKALGIIMLMMKYEGAEKIDSALEADLIVRINRGNPSAQTGANRIDVATHFIYRGCLTNDAALIQNNANLIYEENDVRTGEGLQHDYSYAQHSIQLHIFGYGGVYVSGQLNIAYVTAGTMFAIPADKLANLSIFLRKTIVNEMRGQSHTFNSFGRQISRPGGAGIRGWGNHFDKMAVLDPANATAYNNATARINGTQPVGYAVDTFQKHYWRTDYTTYQSPDFSFSTRFSSTRTVQAETGNGENLKGGYLSIGSTSIMVNGNEYYDIFPVWDWNKIPGTTAPQKTTVPTTPWLTQGTSTFAGGASTGKIGVSAFSMNQQWNVSAQKGWFMFGNEIVCLGTGITTNATSPTEVINTTINQAFLDGDVTVSQGSNISAVSANTQTTLTNPKWVLHDSIAYFFPNAPTNVNLSSVVQSGSWYDINRSHPLTTISKNVFKLWFNHGTAPSGTAASYAYIIVPGKKNIAEVQAYNASDIVIIANTSTVQAVKKSSAHTIEAIFYEAGSITSDSVTITVDQPCTLILENINTNNPVLTVSDPSKTANRTINVTVSASNAANQTLSFLMPQGSAFLGSSVTQTMEMNDVDNAISLSLLPVADAYVRNGSYASNNYGNEGTLVIKNDGSSYKRETYLKFDLSGIANNKVASAKLKLALSGGNTYAPNITVSVRKGETDAWQETGITWNNMPATLDGIIASASGKTSGTIEFDVTNAVLEEIGDDKILTLKVSSETPNPKGDITFFSKEASEPEQHPALLIELEAESTGILPVEDSYVRNGSYASNNYGNDVALVVKNDGASYKRETYLKFDLSDIANEKIGTAKLKLTLSGGNTYAPNTTIAVRKGSADAWSETGITWNNKPAVADNIIASTAGKTSGTLEFDITGAVLEELAADKTLTLRVSSETLNAQGDITLFSKETATIESRPVLLLQVAKNITALMPVKDSYVRDGSYANQNYGQDPVLTVKNDQATSYERQGFLQFNLGQLTSSNIATAKLRLYVKSAGSSIAATEITANAVADDTWTETGITWNNKPATGAPLDSVYGSNAEYMEFDITGQVKAEAEGDQLLSLNIGSTVSNPQGNINFYTKEDSIVGRRPQLIIELSSNPVVASGKKATLSLTPMAVETVNAARGISVYPNPVAGTLNIQAQTPITSIRIIDVNGVIRKQVILDEKKNIRRTAIDVSALNSGLYILVTETNKEKVAGKFMKQ